MHADCTQEIILAQLHKTQSRYRFRLIFSPQIVHFFHRHFSQFLNFFIFFYAEYRAKTILHAFINAHKRVYNKFI